MCIRDRPRHLPSALAFSESMKFSRSFTMSDQVVGVAPRTASPVRRWYVVAAVLALVIMVLSIQYGSDWLLNFLHVMTGALWTGIDLFMGFVVGPVLKLSLIHISEPTRPY